MNNFSIICLHILDECPKMFRKVLKRNEYYFFNNWYRLGENGIVRNENSSFERDFFGSNISIQAIVGKNGSGKSSILDLLYRLINNLSYVAVENKYRATAQRLYFIRGIQAEFYYELNGILGCVTCKDKYVYFKYGEDIDLEYHFSENPDNDETAVNHVDTSKNRYSRAVDVDDRVMGVFENFFYSLAINYSMQALVPQDYWNELACGDNKDDNPENSWLDPLYDKNDGYLVPFGIEPYKGKNRIDLAVQKELSDSRVSVLMIDAYNKSKRQNKHVEFISGYKLDDVVFYLRDTRPDKNDDDAWAEYEYLNKIIEDPTSVKFSVFSEEYSIPIPVENSDTKELFRELMVYIIEKTFNIIENYPSFENYNNLRAVYFDEDNVEDFEGTYADMLRSVIEIICNDTSHISYKIKQAVNLIRAIQFNENVSDYLHKTFSYFDFIKEFYDKDELGFESPTEILEHYPPSIFEPEIYIKKAGADNEDSFKYTSLSSGERQFAISSASYLYHIRNLMSVSVNDELRVPYRNINLFLDEIELCYHPEYQRQYIKNVITSLEDYGVTSECHVNILLTTHSPFVLSDIPKSNILFLREGNIAHEEITYDTFGANINDLFHKSFFLENGFSGCLAQKRINDIAELLTGTKRLSPNKEEYIKKTIDIVGDPLIKHQLLLLYDRYICKFNSEQRQKRILELEAELRLLNEL